MKPPRFRLRMLMLAVAVVALLVWSAMMGLRSYEYFRRAREYGTQERGWRESAARNPGMAEFGSQCAEYFAELSRKYRRAMWRPWSPVPPDPHAPGYDQMREQEIRAKIAAPTRTPDSALTPTPQESGGERPPAPNELQYR
jgi:hypothetical protein